MQTSISTLSRSILRDLCTNSRVSITELSEKHNISRKIAKDRIVALEKEFGLKYTLELDYEALGFASLHVLHVNFSKKPKPEELREIFAKSKAIQFAALTEGEFDMVLFVLTKEPKDYFKWEMGIWLLLSKYGVSTASSEVIIGRFGFVQINNDLIRDSAIEDVYKKIILVLNENSRISNTDLSKKIGMSQELTNYYLKKLNKEGIIKRYTAIVTKSPVKYNIAYFSTYTVKEKVEERVHIERQLMFFTEPQEIPVVNAPQMMFSLTGSESTFDLAAYDDFKTGLEKTVQLHDKIYKADSPKTKYATITDVVKGVLPIRNLAVKENYDLTFGGVGDV